jgi:hypothetical protein
MQVWKIQRISDGKFSGVRRYTRWTSQGRVFSNLGHLKNHLRAILFDWYSKTPNSETYKGVPFSDIHVVGFSLGEEGKQTIPLQEIIDALCK